MSYIFRAYFILVTAIVVTLGFFFIPLPRVFIRWVPYTWSFLTKLGLRFMCGVRHQVVGREHIPSQPFIIASEHQSAWETALFFLIFKPAVCMFKGEFMKIPIFNWVLVKMGLIPVNRNMRTRREIMTVINKAKSRLADGYNIFIFPQGTRVGVGDQVKLKKSFALIAKEMKAPVLPVKIDSGYFWPPKNPLNPGTITVEILPPIHSQNTDDILKSVEEAFNKPHRPSLLADQETLAK